MSLKFKRILKDAPNYFGHKQVIAESLNSSNMPYEHTITPEAADLGLYLKTLKGQRITQVKMDHLIELIEAFAEEEAALAVTNSNID